MYQHLVPSPGFTSVFTFILNPIPNPNLDPKPCAICVLILMLTPVPKALLAKVVTYSVIPSPYVVTPSLDLTPVYLPLSPVLTPVLDSVLTPVLQPV